MLWVLDLLFSALDRLTGLMVKASVLRTAGLGSIPVFEVDLLPSRTNDEDEINYPGGWSF